MGRLQHEAQKIKTAQESVSDLDKLGPIYAQVDLIRDLENDLARAKQDLVNMVNEL